MTPVGISMQIKRNQLFNIRVSFIEMINRNKELVIITFGASYL